jgi:hypothetical protein
VSIPKEAAMKRFEQSLFRVFVAGTLSAWSILACNAPPPSVGGGGGTGAPAGASVGGATGSPSGTGGGAGPGEGGTTGNPFVLPDAAVIYEDVLPDLPPASGDGNSGALQSKLQKKPADLLLVLDRSTSMTQAMDSSNNCNAGSTTCSQRWATIISSLGKVLTSSSADLYWGLKFFSSPNAPAPGSGGRSGGTGGAAGRGGGTGGTAGRGGGTGPIIPGGSNNCYVASGVEVPVGPGNTSKVQSQITSAGNAGYTPTRAAIDAAVAYLKTVTDSNSKFILLATDGEPNCGDGATDTGASDLSATKTALQNAATAGYKVFVIGVGPETANLTELAQAGGTDKFYPALTPDDLSAALSTIVGIVSAGCTYELPSAAIVPDAVGVYIDKGLIPQSDTDGWSYAPGSSTTININGSYCEALTSGKSTQVEIFLPCQPADPIPPFVP